MASEQISVPFGINISWPPSLAF